MQLLFQIACLNLAAKEHSQLLCRCQQMSCFRPKVTRYWPPLLQDGPQVIPQLHMYHAASKRHGLVERPHPTFAGPTMVPGFDPAQPGTLIYPHPKASFHEVRYYEWPSAHYWKGSVIGLACRRDALSRYLLQIERSRGPWTL